MQKKINHQTIAKNVTASILVQLVSLCVGFLVNIFIPKGIDEYQYAYWQSFVLYLGYVGVLHFGLLDGIVLRYAQYDYEDLNRQTFHTLFLSLLGMTSVIAAVAIGVAALFLTGVVRLTVVLVALGIIGRNVFTYNSYLFQITNRIREYAKLIAVQRLTYGISVVVLLVLRVNDFWWFCLAELLGDAATILLASFYNRGLYFGKGLPRSKAFAEWKACIASGIKLMLANWSSLLLLGSAKMVVQWRWDELVFGKVAFSFTVSNLFLSLVVAVSVVVFPALKRMDAEQMPALYKKLRGVLSPLLVAALLCYFPGCYLIQLILPKYSQSLPYLGVLFPIILFTAKVSLLTNNYLKAYRKENQLLAVNAASIALAFLLYLISAYVCNSVTVLLICVVLVNIFNSVVSELVVMKTIRVWVVKEILVEAGMTMVFIGAVMTLSAAWACLVYAAALAVYILLFRENIKQILVGVFGIFSRTNP